MEESGSGGILLMTNWPWTIFVVMKTNKKLMTTPPENAGPEARAARVVESRSCCPHSPGASIGYGIPAGAHIAVNAKE